MSDTIFKSITYTGLFERDRRVLDAKIEYNRYKNMLIGLLKSKPDWQRFLEHYAISENACAAYISKGIIINRGHIPDTVIFKYDDTRYGDTIYFETQEIPIRVAEDFIYTDNFFAKIDAQIERGKKFNEDKRKQEKEIEERERRIYEYLKKKYDTN